MKKPTISPAMDSAPDQTTERATLAPVTLSHEASSGERTPAQPFLSDVIELRRRAREHIMQGALTASYQGSVEQAIEILNQALATELVCTLRYRYHAIMAKGIESHAVTEEFWEHSREELQHADWIAERIDQLGGNPEMNPAGLLTKSHSEYQEGGDLREMIREDLIAERIAVDSYREIIRYFAEHDPTSRRMMEKILAKEEEHAEELSTLLATIDHSKIMAKDMAKNPGADTEQDESESLTERSA